MAGGHFHARFKKFTRAKGKAAVRAAAYRAGQNLYDDRTGTRHNYENKAKDGGVLAAEIILPTDQPVPDWAQAWQLAKDKEARRQAREVLWNNVEDREGTNPKAAVAYEWEIALPHELNADQRYAAAREAAQFIADRYQAIADMAIHAPDVSNGADERNYHVHIMFTPRAIEAEGFAKKKFRDYSRFEKEAKEKGVLSTTEEIQFVLKTWAEIGNKHLEQAGFEPNLDHRSYEERGIDKEAEKHLGPAASAKERRGEDTAIGGFNRISNDNNRNREEWAKAWVEKGQNPGHSADRAALLTLQQNERKALWRELQALKQDHKYRWAALFREQRAELKAFDDASGTWMPVGMPGLSAEQMTATARAHEAPGKRREALIQQHVAERRLEGRSQSKDREVLIKALSVKHRCALEEVELLQQLQPVNAPSPAPTLKLQPTYARPFFPSRQAPRHPVPPPKIVTPQEFRSQRAKLAIEDERTKQQQEWQKFRHRQAERRHKETAALSTQQVNERQEREGQTAFQRNFKAFTGKPVETEDQMQTRHAKEETALESKLIRQEQKNRKELKAIQKARAGKLVTSLRNANAAERAEPSYNWAIKEAYAKERKEQKEREDDPKKARDVKSKRRGFGRDIDFH